MPSRPGQVGRVTVAGREVLVQVVADAYPGLDALHLTPLADAPSSSQLRRLGLTRRQAEVLELAARGWTAAKISRELNLSRRTVEKHFATIYERLGVTGRAQAIVAALQAAQSQATA